MTEKWQRVHACTAHIQLRRRWQLSYNDDEDDNDDDEVMLEVGVKQNVNDTVFVYNLKL